MRKFGSALALALVVSVSLAGGARAQVTHDPAKVDAGSYTIDPGHTQIIWGVSHLGFTTYYGQFANVSGSLVLAPESPAASKLDVTFPTASVMTTSPKLDAQLRSEDWFDAAQYPQVRFVSTQVKPTGPGSADIEGELTLHGVTKPVTLKAVFVGAGRNQVSGDYNVGFQATGGLNRSEFGIEKYLPIIGDRVELTISGAFEKKS